MGSIFSKKARSTIEILEGLEQEISELELYSRGTYIQQRHLIGYFLISSVIVYLGTATYTYFTWTPKDRFHSLLILGCFFVFPVLVWSLRFIISWLYAVKLENNQEKLISLQNKKKKILDNVKNTETYKVAMEILDRFDPERKRMAEFGVVHSRTVSLGNPVGPTPRRRLQGPENRKQLDATPFAEEAPSPMIFSSKPRPRITSIQPSISMPLQISPAAADERPSIRSEVPPDPAAETAKAASSSGPSAIKTSTPAPQSTAVLSQQPQLAFKPATPPVFMPPRALPRPVPPPERSALDKIVDYLTVDGPNNRFALICAQCSGHNGMALQEEFEYLAFRCCYCYAFNPARKHKLKTPSLHDVSRYLSTEFDGASADANLVRHSSADPIMANDKENSPRQNSSDQNGEQKLKITVSRSSSSDSQLLEKGYEALAHIDEAVATTTATLLDSAEAAMNCPAMAESAPSSEADPDLTAQRNEEPELELPLDPEFAVQDKDGGESTPTDDTNESVESIK